MRTRFAATTRSHTQRTKAPAASAALLHSIRIITDKVFVCVRYKSSYAIQANTINLRSSTQLAKYARAVSGYDGDAARRRKRKCIVSI